MAFKLCQAIEGGQEDVLDDVVYEIRSRRKAVPCVGVDGIDMPGDEPGRCLPVLPKDGGNELALVGPARRRFLASRRPARQAWSWRSHTVIVVEQRVLPRDAPLWRRVYSSGLNGKRDGG